jgi:hypothetical protein
VHGPAIKDMSDRLDWVEKFVQLGAVGRTQDAPEQHGPGSTAAGTAGGSTAPASTASTEAAGSASTSGALPELPGAPDQQQQQQQWEQDQQGRQQQGQQQPGKPPPPPRLPEHAQVMTARSLSSQSMETPESPTLRSASSVALHVGVLQYSPSLEPFPLLADTAGYEPNTLNINEDEVSAAEGWCCWHHLCAV